MTPQEAVAKLDAIRSDNEQYEGLHGRLDIEAAHAAADNVLGQFVASTALEVAEAYDRVVERAGDWWYA